MQELNVTLEGQVVERAAELAQAVERLESVRAIGEAVATAITVDARMQAMVQGVAEHLGFDVAGAGLYDSDSGQLAKMVIYPIDERYQEALQTVNLNPAAPGVPHRSTNPMRKQLMAGEFYLGHSLADLLSPPMPRAAVEAVQRMYGIKTILVVPLPSEEKVVGTLFVATRRPEISIKERRAVQLVARQTATAIASARSYEALRESEERYRLLFNSGDEARFVYPIQDNKPGKFVEVNEVACKRLGYSREELLNLSYLDLNSPEMLGKVAAVQQEFLTKGYMLLEMVHLAKDGRRIPVEVNAHLFDLNGQPAVFSIARDITERKRAEEKLRQTQEQVIRSERLAAIGELAATVAHELRNPLSVIRTSAYYVKDKLAGTDAKVLSSLERLEKNVIASDKIIYNLLNFTKIPSPVLYLGNLNEVVRTALAEVALPEQVKVETQFAADLPQIMLDTQQLNQVFQNLIDNAVQAMPQGGRLAVRTWQEEGCVAASVSDTGEGIPSKNREQIFERLFTTKVQGIGLGLSICRRVVEAHNGTIEVESQMEKGSTFTVRLPISRAN